MTEQIVVPLQGLSTLFREGDENAVVLTKDLHEAVRVPSAHARHLIRRLHQEWLSKGIPLGCYFEPVRPGEARKDRRYDILKGTPITSTT